MTVTRLRWRRPDAVSDRNGPGHEHRYARTIGITELVIGAAGLAGGALLAIRPDGSLLGMDRTLLAGSQFADWRAPGLLLALFVGGGWLVAAVTELRRARPATLFSVAAGLGLAVFELVEYGVIGWFWLEGVMAAAGLFVAALAVLRLTARRAPKPAPAHLMEHR